MRFALSLPSIWTRKLTPNLGPDVHAPVGIESLHWRTGKCECACVYRNCVSCHQSIIPSPLVPSLSGLISNGEWHKTMKLIQWQVWDPKTSLRTDSKSSKEIWQSSRNFSMTDSCERELRVFKWVGQRVGWSASGKYHFIPYHSFPNRLLFSPVCLELPACLLLATRRQLSSLSLRHLIAFVAWSEFNFATSRLVRVNGQLISLVRLTCKWKKSISWAFDSFT